MTGTRSLSSELREVSRSFREKISHAEDRIDLMNSFSMAAREVVKKGIKSDADIRIEDITLDVNSDKGFNYSDRVREVPEFKQLLSETDIESQILHLADAAKKRCKRLLKHTEKTNLKIRQR
ncbi:MAG: hypothetical protein CVV49_19285 [Spirochaetae bacterium HGW-Spirochaetae-5]|nr:MAG: hypothetical protein CVV49_19285 [Spirochaetae bacterium HGW-Spirochaetae-5]